MPQPLTWNSNLTWNAPGAVWNGFVAEQPHIMTSDNKISATLSAQDMTDILAAFGVIKAKLPFLINLTPSDRQRLPTIGTERGGMNTTFPMEMHGHAELVPSYVNVPEMDKDSALWDQLAEIASCAREVCEGVEDTQQAVGNDLYQSYLSFYQNVGQAAKRNVAGTGTIYDSLKPWFQRGSTPPPTPPPGP